MTAARVAVSGYGPRVTDARVEELRAMMQRCALLLEAKAAAAAPAHVVVVGRFGRLAEVVVGVLGAAASRHPVAVAGTREGPAWAITTLARAELVDWLRAAGRTDDAAKVEGGPPDQPEPAGARLFVCLVDDACVAVTWSTPAPALDLIYARRVF